MKKIKNIGSAFSVIIPIIVGFWIVSLSGKANPGFDPGINHWWPAFVGTFIMVTGFTYTHARSEAKKYIKAGWPKVIRAAIRLGIAGLVSLIIIRSISWPWFYYLMFTYGIFAVEFDLLYNWFKGQKWDYLGSNSTQDKAFQKMPLLLLILDLALMISGIVLFTLNQP